jgi:hypothetical protein
LITLLKSCGSQFTGASNVDAIIGTTADRRKRQVEVEKTRENMVTREPAKGNAALPLTKT